MTWSERFYPSFRSSANRCRRLSRAQCGMLLDISLLLHMLPHPAGKAMISDYGGL